MRGAKDQVNDEEGIWVQGGFTVAKGAFSGVIWGAVVAVAGAGGLSLAYPDFKPGAEVAAVQDASVDAAASDDTVIQDAVVEEATTQEMPAENPDTDMAQTQTSDQMAAPEAVSEEIAEPDVEPTTDNAPTDVTIDEGAEIEVAGTEVFEPDADPSDVTEPETADAEDVTAESDTTDADADIETADVITTEETTDDTTEVNADDTIDEASDEVAENADAAQSIKDEIIAALPKPEGTVGDLAPSVTTGRLPSLASEDEPAEDVASAVAPPPFELFASQAPIESDKPLMAIVLVDTGDSALGVEALDSFPYPLTFAVNASAPDAAERMQIYRDKGFEVLALIDLPRGATPSDVEVAMSAYFAAVPEAVGILEGVDTGVQSSREMADQLTQIVLDSGHGMLLQKSGLNTARKLAQREGIPAATVFRDFDGNGQSASVMRRFLDQAAFRAGQEGGVVMMGRLQAETISALLIWGLADRASRVALVPVSAVLEQEPSDDG